VPINEIEPDTPLFTCFDVKIRYGLFCDKKPISVAQVSAVDADNEPRKPKRKFWCGKKK